MSEPKVIVVEVTGCGDECPWHNDDGSSYPSWCGYPGAPKGAWMYDGDSHGCPLVSAAVLVRAKVKAPS